MKISVQIMTTKRQIKRPHPALTQAGLTLLEMLVAVAVLAIILTTVAPGIQNIIIKNRITADLNNLSAVAQRARFTAVDEQTSVTLCPTTNYAACTNNWKNAKMVFVDANGNGSRDNSEALIIASDPLNTANAVYGITGSLVFDEQGGINRAATITLCPSDNNADYASALLLSLYGRISVAVDSNGDDIKEDLAGDNLACS
ncbi:GspH/FimT family pseudopilin [Alteromonas mediterranea]|uniref:GspH/FimT family pseudopilin n=1 Tax=Alteromonas mediterranea TaxID=314275 RepID=UPI002FE3874D